MKKQPVLVFVLSAFTGLAITLGVARADVSPLSIGPMLKVGSALFFPTPDAFNDNSLLTSPISSGDLYISDSASWIHILDQNDQIMNSQTIGTIYVNEQIGVVSYGNFHVPRAITGNNIPLSGFNLTIRTPGTNDGNFDIVVTGLTSACVETLTVPCDSVSGEFFIAVPTCSFQEESANVSIANITCTTPPDIQGNLNIFATY